MFALEDEFFTLARMASALEERGARLRRSESTAEVEVAGDGVCVGVQGDGGPTPQFWAELGNLDSGVSEMT